MPATLLQPTIEFGYRKTTRNRRKQHAQVELIVDNFAGGGGASLGIEMALGRAVDIAVNHDPSAIAMHEFNHPATRHYCESVWKIDPVLACKGQPVGLAWFSPDCRHFSRAKGSKPVSRKIRCLAWIVIRWARKVKPRLIMLEYVEKGLKYLHDFVEADHSRLAAELRRFTKTRVVVSYYDHPLLDTLYTGWTKVHLEATKALVNQGMRDERGAVKAPEVLLINGDSYTDGGMFQ